MLLFIVARSKPTHTMMKAILVRVQGGGDTSHHGGKYLKVG